ncbi:uncharacterized protein [Mycetomoellerius zeteki]|uniref:uncharacterized protein n=1 Tax=Mycetomoellerius zeteki TaxID=64791 RepID=UPI00084E3BAF|nr:PREDICTED: uncharacterized protein LOC108721386 [Trachymyrmex zeteki]
MKGIYVAIAFSVVNSDQDFSEEVFLDDIPTECPLPQPGWRNTTTNVAHEYNCSLFYKCNVGQGIEQTCPLMVVGDPLKRLHYNRHLQVCDWPWLAGCISCPTEYPNGTFPPPEKINNPNNNCQYITCANGVPSGPFNCPPGTCFSRRCQECVADRSINAKCNNYQCKEGDRKVHDCDCTLYQECKYLNGQFYYVWKTCEGGLHYSPTQKICLPPNIAGCPYIPHFGRKKLL